MVKSMNTRMDKYYKENTLETSRTDRNQEIYNRVNEEDFDKLSLTSNISIIDADTTNLDLEKLKQLLDEKYTKQKPKRKDIEEVEEEDEDIEDTKEYDLKKVIDEAHKNKDTDYDRERFKKLRETQYDILNSLNLNRDEEPIIEDSLTVEEANLMNLIKTVNENALKREEIIKKENNLLDDLKGNDDTEVLSPITFADEEETDEDITTKKPTLLEELEKTKQLSKKEIMEEYQKVEDKEKEEITDDAVIDTTNIDFDDKDEVNEYLEDLEENEKVNTFYTGKLEIKESDLDDFEELQKEMKTGGAIVKILVSLIIIIVLAVGLYLLNKYMNLGLF